MLGRGDVEELYRRYAHVVFRRCRVLLRAEDEAMDAMQEVFIRALRYGRSFRAGRKPLPWLFRIATRLCFDRLRARREESLEEPGRVAAPAGVDPEQRAMLVELLGRHDALTREVVVAYHLEQMSMEEVAALVGRSRKTVGKRLARFQSDTQRMRRAWARGEEG